MTLSNQALSSAADKDLELSKQACQEAVNEVIQKNNLQMCIRDRAAIKENGLDAYCSPIRGGTDGARLTFKGLPCPNLGTGGFNYHGPYEYCSLTMMEKQVQILLYILKNTASK